MAPAALALALVLGGCGNSGLTLARQACGHVKASIRLYDVGLRAADAGKAARDRTLALEQLESALPLAAQANSADPQWNPLMTTLEEIDRNSEANLLGALRSQCAVADSSGEQTPIIAPTGTVANSQPSPSTLPGQ